MQEGLTLIRPNITGILKPIMTCQPKIEYAKVQMRFESCGERDFQLIMTKIWSVS